MEDLVTDALVIDKEDSGEYNSRVFLYTRELGSVAARATSARKITSKLAAHLEPLNIVQVRLNRRRGSDSPRGDGNFQISDALLLCNAKEWRKSTDTTREALKLVSVLREFGFCGDADPDLWNALYSMFSSLPARAIESYAVDILKSLGFDPRFASCRHCLAEAPTRFLFQDLSFYCATCAPHTSSVMVVRLAP